MALDTNDLQAIREIVEASFGHLPIRLVGALNDGQVAQYQLYTATRSGGLGLRIGRKGPNVHIEWLDIDGSRIAETILRGV